MKMIIVKFIHRALLVPVLIATSVVMATGQEVDFETVASSEDALKVDDGRIRARLSRNGCEAGFEAACSQALQRSEYVTKSSHKNGDRVVYSWEIFVPAEFKYKSPGAYLRAGRFLVGDGGSILNFLLDEKVGYDIGRKICFGPEGFGKWHSIQVRVRWDSTRKKNLRDKTPGELRVSCDGAEILALSGRPNISDEDEVRIALGLAGALELADGDQTSVSFRNIKIETW